ncbi:hypothetical protein AJ80_06862 [Polytolypa hystricis UAMH7299]|uniref:Transcription factor TFIIIC triple barrel domain-containing protein n=1 Tax=Polytolypa hystricis (strain UAMH7299) TaxID=1447883 RepID=A0A2B7XTD7_POLH7|nr:hypothetical protein AJ80_06862 [Polytolypa hystricis UAMH7299]
MPLDTIYVTRHGHRLNWTIDLATGTYHATYPTPTGIPVDPTLTGPGIKQSHELAAHINTPEFSPKPCRVYCSPFYRCLQTIQPTVEALQERQSVEKKGDVDLDVRIENGIGEWFGSSRTFTHPSPATPSTLQSHFPTILRNPDTTSSEPPYKPHLIPSPHGETISELHDRLATTLSAIIASVDAEITTYEAAHPETANQSRALLICTHAAPLIALGRVLTGDMPEDSSMEDFRPFVASLSTFVRREKKEKKSAGQGVDDGVVVDGAARFIGGCEVPVWKGGRGVGGGWDCVANGDCSFLTSGEERGWHFHGEEDFNSMPDPPVAPSTPKGQQQQQPSSSVVDEVSLSQSSPAKL